MILSVILVFVVVIIKACYSQSNDIYVGTLSDFARTQPNISLHFSCPESNFFTTNCACHLKCTDRKCQNAIDLCKKHRNAYACKYVLLRGGNKLATLKREISVSEQKSLDITEFQSMTPLHNTINRPKISFRDMTIADNEVLGTVGKINSQIKVRIVLKYAIIFYIQINE